MKVATLTGVLVTELNIPRKPGRQPCLTFLVIALVLFFSHRAMFSQRRIVGGLQGGLVLPEIVVAPQTSEAKLALKRIFFQ